MKKQVKKSIKDFKKVKKQILSTVQKSKLKGGGDSDGVTEDIIIV